MSSAISTWATPIQQDGRDAVITFGDNSEFSVRLEHVDSAELKGYSVSEDAADAIVVAVDTF
jgi:hypothetical protein